MTLEEQLMEKSNIILSSKIGLPSNWKDILWIGSHQYWTKEWFFAQAIIQSIFDNSDEKANIKKLIAKIMKD